MKCLIIRGLVREKRHWGPFPKIFEENLKQVDAKATVFAIDFPGFGSEAHRPSPRSISQIVDDMRARWLKMKEGDEEWNLFSMSLGGMVSMNWVSRYPNDFKKLVLVNSSISDLSPLHKRMKPINYPTIISLFFNHQVASREEIILKMTTNLKGDKLKERAKQHADFALLVKKKDALSQILAAIRFKAPEKIPIPTLVLASEKDQLVDVSCSEAIANRFQAKILKHPNANHDLPLDDPEWVSQKVAEWFKSE